MKPALIWLLAAALASPVRAQAIGDAPAAPARSVAGGLPQEGWTLLKEGDGDGSIARESATPGGPNAAADALKLDATRTPPPGKGRIGASQSTWIPVQAGKYYDVTFAARTQRGAVGVVFSLETADGRIIARTTLASVGGGGGGQRGGRRGRGRRGGGATTETATVQTPTPAPTPAGPAAWPKHFVSLHARESAAEARLTMTPIEPSTIWFDAITVTERK